MITEIPTKANGKTIISKDMEFMIQIKTVLYIKGILRIPRNRGEEKYYLKHLLNIYIKVSLRMTKSPGKEQLNFKMIPIIKVK